MQCVRCEHDSGPAVESGQKIVAVIDGLAYIDPNDHRKCETAVLAFLTSYEQQTRRDALAEAMRVAHENKHNGISRVLYALDRLREGR